MILGIGSDLTSIDRISASIDRLGNRFLRRVFTPDEIARAETTLNPAGFNAKRWAAKEAVLKALGTGLNRKISWRCIETYHLEGSRPAVRLLGGAADHLAAICPPGHRAEVRLTLSDEQRLAQAFVVIEAGQASSEPRLMHGIFTTSGDHIARP